MERLVMRRRQSGFDLCIDFFAPIWPQVILISAAIATLMIFPEMPGI